MPVFSIYNQDESNRKLFQTITAGHFGTNLLVTQPPKEPDGLVGSKLAAGIEELGVKSLRFPGGSITESVFSMENPNAVTNADSGQHLISQSEFIEFCSVQNLSANFVIQTSTGFTKSAAAALTSNEYGSRNISAEYLQVVHNYVRDTVLDALNRSRPVVIDSFEIGNEFWESGQMTAKEYGRLAAAVLVAADTAIEEAYAMHPELEFARRPNLLVQSVHASGAFSPNADQVVYVGGGEAYKNIDQVPHGVSTVPIVIPGQGNAGAQLSAITQALNNDLSRSLIDGVVDHYYANQGLVDADSASNYTFSQMSQFELQIGLKVGDLERYVTEWNTKLSNVADNRGIEGATMLTEIFYEIATHGVQSANIWPLVYDSLRNNLLQGQDANMTTAGAVFELMAESLVGTKPILDCNLVVNGNEVDVHAFSSDRSTVLFTSNRSDHTVTKVQLDLGNSAGAVDEKLLSEKYFIVSTYISETQEVQGINPTNNMPIYSTTISHSAGLTQSGSLLNLGSLAASTLVRTEITYVTEGADTIDGRSANDRIDTLAGDDLVHGNAGWDILAGEKGNDSLFGGDGTDRIYGGDGNDFIDGGLMRDILRGGSGNDQIFGGGGDDWIDGGRGNDTIYGGVGNDKIWGGGGNDQFVFNLQDGGVDRIVDFVPKSDKIVFTGGVEYGIHSGTLDPSKFSLSTSGLPPIGPGQILYDKSRGDLYVDYDTNGAVERHLLLHVKSGLDLTSENFMFL